MRGRGRADMAGAVGAGRGDRQPAALEQRLRDRVRGDAHGNGIEPGGSRDRRRGSPRASQHQRQRAWPERGGQLAPSRGRGRRGRTPRPVAGTCTISGLKRGRPLASKTRGNGARVGGVGAEAVDGLGRERDEPAGAQKPAASAMASDVAAMMVIGGCHPACRRDPSCCARRRPLIAGSGHEARDDGMHLRTVRHLKQSSFQLMPGQACPSERVGFGLSCRKRQGGSRHNQEGAMAYRLQ